MAADALKHDLTVAGRESVGCADPSICVLELLYFGLVVDVC